jgi:anti-sigma-K factor RskA
MSEAFLTKDVIRSFLLGKLDQEERQRIEEAFVTDSELQDLILMAEDELVEEYLEDSLDPEERSRFLTQYMCAPRQQRKLRVTKSLHALATARSAAALPTSPGDTPLRASKKTWRSRLILVPLAAGVTVALVIAAVWLLQVRRSNTQLAKDHSALEQELAELNTSSAHSLAPAQFLSFALPPVSVRSLQPPAELVLPTEASVVELWLIWNEAENVQNNEAVLKKLDSSEQFTVRNLQVENKPQGKAARLRIPVHMLSRGVYKIAFGGVSSDGKVPEHIEYTFVVSGQ